MQPEQTDTARLARTADGRLDLDALLALGREEQVEALAPQPGAGRHERPRAGALGPGQPAGEHVLSSSFGIQAALMLHLVSRERADVPVVLTDTGYLFPRPTVSSTS